MKKIIFILAVFAFAMQSCKKEIEVKVNKTYVEEGVTGSTLGFGGIILTLMPDGKADLLNGGDIVERGTYSVKGSSLTVTINNQSYKFKVISDVQLKYDNRILNFNVE